VGGDRGLLNIALLDLGESGINLIQSCLPLKGMKIVGVVVPSGKNAEYKVVLEAGIPVVEDYRSLPADDIDIIFYTGNNMNWDKFKNLLKHKPLCLDSEGAFAFIDIMQKLVAEKGMPTPAPLEKEAIINSCHDGIVIVDISGNIKKLNPAAEKFLGIQAAEARGKPVGTVFPAGGLLRTLQTGRPEFNNKQALGRKVIITNYIPFWDDKGVVAGAAAIFRDITEIGKMTSEIASLKEVQQLLKAIINSTQDAISVVNKEGKGILINPAYTRLTGLVEKDVLGKPPTVDIAEGESMHLKVLETGKPVHGAVMKVGPKRREVVVNVAPIMVDRELKGSVAVIHDISEIKRLNDELERAKRRIRFLEAKYTFEDIIGNSYQLRLAVEQARRVADTPATVLLRGESGTGKELFAHAIHNASRRRKGQFIRVNCSAIAESILESELFGYEGGAFTGARRGGKVGLFEEANGGTILLDEIVEIRPSLQAKLLRVLQEKEILRVGSTRPISVDVRVIAATNADLERAVKDGTFREDLYYRINVVPIFIPPLRKRKEDIPELVHYLLRKFNQEYGRNVESVEPKVIQILQDYDWPGNVRELENVFGRAMINMRFTEKVMQSHHLPLLQQHWGEHYLVSNNCFASGENQTGAIESLQATLQRAEKEAIHKALMKTGGNKTEAARRLGISIRSLYYKLAKHGVKI
jgi:PAS domain S-box-containing protein